MPRLLYRTVGYHVCGARAIRVDILERLADLIRPALAWRVGSSGAKPAGAYDGRAFTVTGAMTSLTGASGEDFASILRALGYRMEKRPKPVESAPTAPVSEPVAEAAVPADMPAAEPAAETTKPMLQVENSSVLIPVPDYSPAESAPIAPADESAPPSVEVAAEGVAESSSAPVSPTPNADGNSQAEVPVVAALAVAEPEMIEVWRSGRPDGPRRKREDKKGEENKRPPRRRERPASQSEIRPAGEAQAAIASAPSSPSAPAEARPHSRRPRREYEPDGERKEKQGRPRPQPSGRDGRPERKERDRGEGRGERFGRGRERRDRDEGNREPRTWTSTNEPRGKEPDPNSPFAKLLALKEQLETNAKERR